MHSMCSFLLSIQDSDPLFLLNRTISDRFNRVCSLSLTRPVHQKLRSQPTLPPSALSYKEPLRTSTWKKEKLSSPTILFSGLIVATTGALPFSPWIKMRKALFLLYWNLAIRLLLTSRDSWVNISILLLCDSSDEHHVGFSLSAALLPRWDKDVVGNNIGKLVQYNVVYCWKTCR